MTHRPRAAALACALAALVLTLAPGAALAHAFLRASVPAVGSTVRTAPGEVTIDFTESVEPAFSDIAVADAQGARVDRGAAHLDGGDARLAVGLKPLPPGRYAVTWHATSTDTHHTQGGFGFTVAP